MTKQNKLIAKYRVWGLVIIVLALLGLAFSILLFQEQIQLSARAQYRSAVSR